MNNHNSIGRNLIIVNKYFKMFLRDKLQQYDMNAQEGIVLLMMYRKNKLNERGNTQDELIKEIHCDKGVMTRTMKELENKGFVVRDVNPDDSRSYVFSLSDKGLEYENIIIDILKEWNDNLLSGVDEDEREVVENVLNKMSKNVISYYEK